MTIHLTDEQTAMLGGRRGAARQTAMRLLLDLAAAAGASELVPIESAHLSGVSPLTGGLGLRRFLARLASDPQARVVVPTTLNAAGCDAAQFEAMRIAVPGFLEQSQEIVELYTRLGVRPIQSCVPYEWAGVVTEGAAAWAESNAVCFGNSYCGLASNRESGLSALAAALSGCTPNYGLLQPEGRRPNIEVIVTCAVDDPTDFSILGDWIGRRCRPEWRLPFGPIPLICGLQAGLSHEQRKALSAAAANYGSPLVYVDGSGDAPDAAAIEARLTFGQEDLGRRYDELRPRFPVSLVVIGCPQASVGELRAVAQLLRGRQVAAEPQDGSGRPPLWVFTSSANKAIAEQAGVAAAIRHSGALLLENTCPEVVPYNPMWVKHVLTNSMKAEHYIRSGLNGIPTSVMRLADCVAVACGELAISGEPPPARRPLPTQPTPAHAGRPKPAPASDEDLLPGFEARGRGLPSQGDFTVRGEALVTDAPITFLGFVNRETGAIEEPGHPADGQSLAGKVAIYPRGTGSTVAPYVLLELYYRGTAPMAVVNTELDQQSAPACSVEGIPYAYGFDGDVLHAIRPGDTVELSRRGDVATIRVLGRAQPMRNEQ